MPNKYRYGKTFEELREEEDREVINDYYRQMTDYYQTLTWMNEILLNALDNMSDKEIENIVKSNLIMPVVRIK